MSQVLRWTGRVTLVLAGWAAIMLAMPLVGPAGRQVAVLGDRSAAVRAILDAGGAVVDVRRGAVIARGPAGFVPALYASGAPVVIEGRVAAGCFAKAGA